MTSPCPCGSSNPYEICCEPFHSFAASPSTAEALMRSRYCAFVKARPEYLENTTWPSQRKNHTYSPEQFRTNDRTWLGLTIHDANAGLEGDVKGTVSFTARFMENGRIHEQSERSLFKKKANRWYYVKAL